MRATCASHLILFYFITLRLKMVKLPVIKFLQSFLTSTLLCLNMFVSIELLTKCLQAGDKLELFNFLPNSPFTIVPFDVLIADRV
jgi:hypothetical protein